jgi:aspartate carbamoyltransferase catalytic subunit
MGFEESLADTVRSVSAYCDCIVMRHSCTGDAMDAVRASVAPVVSGGFGVDHHPTQALIDLYAIKKSLGRLERIRIGVVGRLKYSRSAKSLVQALSFFNSAEVRQMAPEGEALLCLPEASTPCTAVTAIDASGLDVLYAAGLPKKNHVMSEMNSEDRERLTITSSVVAALPRHAIVLCPLPRLDEISPDVDDMPCARYFKQSDDGIFVRMAVLDYVTSVNRSVGVTP